MAQKAELHVKDASAFLGLENYLTKNTLQEMKYRRKAAPMAVLSEQHRQDRLGINDPDALASASQAVSDMSTRRARIIGMMHAERWCPPPSPNILNHTRTSVVFNQRVWNRRALVGDISSLASEMQYIITLKTIYTLLNPIHHTIQELVTSPERIAATDLKRHI